VNVN